MISFLAYGFIGGILIGSFGVLGWGYVMTFIATTLLVYFYSYYLEKGHKEVLFFVCVFLIGVSLGVARVNFSQLNKKSSLENLENKKILYTGVIVAEPDVRETNTKLTVLLKSYKLGTTTKNISEKILISTNLYPEFSYGDEISFLAKIEKPKNIDSDSGRIFNYIGYLRARGIWYSASFVYPKIVSKDKANYIKKYLFSIKKNFTDSIEKTIPEPESSLLAGILLGSKQSLGKKNLEEFSQTGVSHVVVLSGYNIAIIGSSIMAFLYFLPKNISFAFGCTGIILFTIFSGGGASAVRAAIMVIVALFANRAGRDYKAVRVLGFTIILMLAPNPLLLVFDPSFQLSILATIGLVFVSPIIIHYFSWVSEKFGLREIISTTIATQLIVMPFLIYNMGLFSVVSLPVNILILGIIPTVMFLGFVTGLLGFVSYYLAIMPGIVTYMILKYQLSVIHFGASLPFAYFKIQKFSFITLALIYFLIFIFLFYLNKKSLKQ